MLPYKSLDFTYRKIPIDKCSGVTSHIFHFLNPSWDKKNLIGDQHKKIKLETRLYVLSLSPAMIKFQVLEIEKYPLFTSFKNRRHNSWNHYEVSGWTKVETQWAEAEPQHPQLEHYLLCSTSHRVQALQKWVMRFDCIRHRTVRKRPFE